MSFSKLFELRGELNKRDSTIISVIGFFVLMSLWQLVCTIGLVPRSLLPSPISVLLSIGPLHFEDELVRNSIYSIKLNILGYLEAIAIALPVGLVMGLFPVVRAATNQYIKALRFIPLAAATGLFICWYGIGDNMKIQFLAVSIIVYLIPVVILRVDEVENVYIHTSYTLGASKLQTILTVFIPAIKSKIIDDIRILVAISWTYITIAESLNMTHGIGMMATQCARRSEVDKVFALLFIISIFGFIQDILFQQSDRVINPHKYV